MSLTEKQVNSPEENIVDINLEGIHKTRFRINGDPNAIIELNLSDLSISERLEQGVQKLEAQMKEIAELDSEDADLSKKLKQADDKMRECIDYIFDYPVSDVCAKGGTMYDPKDGMFRYEVIIDGLTKLYTDNLNAEYKKIKARIQKHTEKYTGPKASKGKRK